MDYPDEFANGHHVMLNRPEASVTPATKLSAASSTIFGGTDANCARDCGIHT